MFRLKSMSDSKLCRRERSPYQIYIYIALCMQSVWVWRMSGLTRDGTVERISRNQIIRYEWGQRKFPVLLQLTTSRMGSHSYYCSACYVTMDNTNQVYAPHNNTFLGAWCKSPNKRILSYKDALHRTQCESIETTVRTRRLLWAGALLRMGDHRLPKRVMSGELENAGKRGPGGKEKEWTDCVADDLRLFGVTGDWRTAALDPGAWYNTVQEGGCRCVGEGRRKCVQSTAEEERSGRGGQG